MSHLFKLKGCSHALSNRPALRERAVQVVLDHQSEHSSRTAAVEVISRQVGVGRETLRRWVQQHQIDHGTREWLSSDENTELKRLRMENRRLKETNETLRRALIFFAGELDPRSC